MRDARIGNSTLKRYEAVIFDLFSTVALWRPERMPLFEWRGKTSHSTMGALRDTIGEVVTAATFEEFIDALAQANETLAARRAREMREFPSIERFELALRNAGYPANAETRAIARTLSLEHMELLAAAVDIPPAHVELLARLGDRYPLALLSNFDHGPTARAILARDGAAGFFDPIVISDEHGWRKPHAKIFDDTLAALGVSPQVALYVGDSVNDDIVGAKGAGLDVAWVNPKDAALPDGIPTPDFTIPGIGVLEDLLP